MSNSRIPSPARSQGLITTPRKHTPRRSRSVCSAKSNKSTRLTALISDSFKLSPMPHRQSVLNDVSDIEVPRRQSWWKNLGENSRHVMEVLNTKDVEVNNIADEFDVEILSQERKEYNLDLPESSDSESISSIVIPQRKLFTHKENPTQKKFGNLINTRETLAKLQKSHFDHEKDIDIGPKNLFNQATKPKTKPVFPAALLNISSKANKTKELPPDNPKVQGQVRNLFGNRAGTKRKNMFADFIVSESEDEIPEIQPKIFGFEKNAQKQREALRVAHSPTSSIDLELDEWKLLPSSTMVENQLEEATTPVKRARLSKLSEAKETVSNINSTENKTKQSNKSISSKNKSKISSNSILTENMEVDNLNEVNENNEILNNSSNIRLTRNKSKSLRETSLKEDNSKAIINQNKQKSSLVQKDEQIIGDENNDSKISSIRQKNVNSLSEPIISNNDDDNFTLQYENDDEPIIEQVDKTITEINKKECNNRNKTNVEDKSRSSKLCNDFADENVKNDKTDGKEMNQSQQENTEQNNSKGIGNRKDLTCSNTFYETEGNNTESNILTIKQNKSTNEKNNVIENQVQIISSGNIQNHNNDKKENNLVLLHEEENESNDKTQNKGLVRADKNSEAEKQHETEQNYAQNKSSNLDKNKGDNRYEKVINNEKQNICDNQSNNDEDNAVKSVIHNESNNKTQNENENEVQNENVHEKQNKVTNKIQKESGNDEQNESEDNVVQNESENGEEEDSEDDGQNKSVQEKPEESEDEVQNESINKEKEDESEDEVQNESRNEMQEESEDESENEEQEDSENEVQNESENKEQDESENVIQNESGNEEQDESENAIQNESENEEQDESKDATQNESENEEQDESENTIQNESESEEEDENEDVIQNESDNDEQNESVNEDQNENEKENESEDDERSFAEMSQNQNDHSEQMDYDEQNKSMEVDDENDNGEEPIDNIVEDGPATANESQIHDKNRKTNVKSPEVILHDKTNQIESFTVHGRNTTVRKTKSIIKNSTRPILSPVRNIRQSLAPVRESTGFSDGTRNSSAEGSGWDSHRTTRKTLRQTLGRDFTPRKSLRALVMEKSAKRHTNFGDHTKFDNKIPQANSTELPAFDSYHEPVEVEETVQESEHEHEISARTRQTTLEMYLQKVKQSNLEKKRKMEEEIRNSLNKPTTNAFNAFRMPQNPIKRFKPVQMKPKSKQKSVISIDVLPSEVLEDMKYKPPKRFQPSNASWITKRLYKFLESKLEPKYDYKARVRAEKLVELLYAFARETKRGTSERAIDELKREMARLDIVQTHFDFYQFFHDFMPREIRVKVVPDIVNKISLPKHGVFSDILQ